MKKKHINLLLLISCLAIVTFIGHQKVQQNGIKAIEGTNDPSSFIAEIDPITGAILKGEQFDPDKPVIRPTYQGDLRTLLDDVIGPTGEKFKGFYKPSASSTSARNSQLFKPGNMLIYRNVGTHNNRALALKIDFLDYTNPKTATVAVDSDGSLKIESGSGYRSTIAYQLVYDEATYPPVTDVYLELPSKISIGKFNSTWGTVPKISVGSANLIKAYVSIPSNWTTSGGKNLVKRSYELKKETGGEAVKGSEFVVMGFDSEIYKLTPETSFVSDNNQRTLLNSQKAQADDTKATFFASDVEAPFTPYYLPVRGNGVENSDTFEAKYDVGQGLTDTYETYLPESLKIVVEDKEGYFKKLNHAPIEFTDKNRTPIDFDIATEFLDKKIVITIPKATLKELKSNQVNMKLNFGTESMDIDKVLENYDAEKDYYKVPLTFYNISTVNGEEKVSEKTEVDATINQGIYGDPVETTVFLDTNSDQLDVNDLISNSATTIPGDSVSLTILERKEFTKEGIVELPVKIQSTKNAALSKIVNVPINVIRGDVVTSDFFENQTWVIDSLNQQFSPKKVDVDIYESDLLKVKRLGAETYGDEYRGQHIPATVNAFKNLELIYAIGIGLTGSLPDELGQLEKLYHIAFLDNNLEGEIPASYGDLVNMTYFNINNNNIGGSIPKEFSKFSKLEYFSVANNPLVGQIPTFPHMVLGFELTNTQLTYNSAQLPPFMTPVESWDRWVKVGYSFLPSSKQTLQLIGNKIVSSRIDTIKPFDQENSGYFDLTIQKPGPEGMEGNSTKEKLYPGHRYTIKDKESGEVLYEGLGEETAEIVYRSKIEYQVTVDQAFDNPANNVTIQGKLPELKFSATPEKIQLKTRVNNDSTDTNLSLEGQLAVFDNRGDENHWKLKMTPSSLSDNQKQLQGEYVYTDLNGNEKVIVDNQAMLLEQGTSGEDEIFPISNQWENGKGLKYRLKPGNLLGNYKGTVMWSLEDAP